MLIVLMLVSTTPLFHHTYYLRAHVNFAVWCFILHPFFCFWLSLPLLASFRFSTEDGFAHVLKTSRCSSRTGCSRIRRTSMRLCLLLRSARSIIIGNNRLTIRTFLFSPPLSAPPPAGTANFCVFFFHRPTGNQRRTSLPLECIATQQLGHVSFSPRGLLSEFKEQCRTRGGQRSGVEDQPQCRWMCRSRTPNAHSLSRSRTFALLFSHNIPFLHSLVRDGQTSPHKPRFVVYYSTCPPLSPSPHSSSFVIGTAVINNNKSAERRKARVRTGRSWGG
jgi:hypothetical protein